MIRKAVQGVVNLNDVEYKTIPIRFNPQEEVWYTNILDTQITADKPSGVKRKLKEFIDQHIAQTEIKVIDVNDGSKDVIVNFNTQSNTMEARNGEKSQWGWRGAYVLDTKENMQLIKQKLNLEKEKEKWEKAWDKKYKPLVAKLDKLEIDPRTFAKKFLKLSMGE